MQQKGIFPYTMQCWHYCYNGIIATMALYYSVAIALISIGCLKGIAVTSNLATCIPQLYCLCLCTCNSLHRYVCIQVSKEPVLLHCSIAQVTQLSPNQCVYTHTIDVACTSVHGFCFIKLYLIQYLVRLYSYSKYR